MSNFRELKEVKTSAASVEAVRLVLSSLPNLQKFCWKWKIKHSTIIQEFGEISSYPNTESFKLYDYSHHDVEIASSLIKACPNKTLLPGLKLRAF
jgi:hypothetical protein